MRTDTDQIENMSLTQAAIRYVGVNAPVATLRSILFKEAMSERRFTTRTIEMRGKMTGDTKDVLIATSL